MVNDTRLLLDSLATRCATRAWRLAVAMLGDPHAAYDAVQQAFLVAARKPEQVPREAPWPWFAAVVVGEVRNMRRKKRPRTNLPPLDERVGPAARLSTDPARAIEQQELGETLELALGELPAEQREAVLLTQMAGMTHAEAARTMGLSRPTLTRRVQDGLARMADLVQRKPEQVGGALALLPLVPPPGGMALASQTWVESAVSAIAASGAAGAAATGAGVMGSKWVVAAGITAALGLGFAGGAVFENNRGADDTSAVDAGTGSVLTASVEPGANTDVRAGLRGAGDSANDLRRNDELQQELRAKDARIAQLEAELAARPSGDVAVGPTFTFGKGGALEGVRQARWGELASASQIVIENIKKVLEAKEAGEQAPKEVFLAIQENVERMRRYEYRTIGKLDTNAKHNGELTHPISLTNLLAARLELAGLPLSKEQIEKINSLGTSYEKDYEASQSRFGEGSLRAERMLAEYKLKGDLQQDLLGVFTSEQRDAVFDPEVQGIASLDLYDPTLMIIHTSPILTGKKAEEIRDKLAGVVAKRYGLDESALARVEPHLSRWLEDVRGSLEAVPPARIKHYTYEQGRQAGEATVRLAQGLLRDGGLSEKARGALLDDYAWFIPRLVK